MLPSANLQLQLELRGPQRRPTVTLPSHHAMPCHGASTHTSAHPPTHPPAQVFACSNCTNRYPYDYFGRRPPLAPSFTYLEDVFVMRDPFVDQAANAPLVLGGVCGACDKRVCGERERERE